MLMRTKSLHRTDHGSQRSNNNKKKNEPLRHQRLHRTTTPLLGGGVRLWGGGKWISSPTTSLSPQQQQLQPFHGSYRSESGLSVSPPLRERQLLQRHKQTPAMTLILRKLQDLLPKYCHAMANGQFVDCCSLLGSATSSTKATVHSSSSTSPKFGPPSFLGGSPASLSSPSRSPLRNWLALAGGADSARDDLDQPMDETHAAAVLEAKMDVLFLLVGVESMYTSMAHAISPQVVQLLVRCYEQTIKDIQLLRFTVCDAFLMNQEGGKHNGNNNSNGDGDGNSTTTQSNLASTRSAAALGESLFCLVSFCQGRIQCIQLQSALWHQPPGSTPNFSELSELFESILSTLQAASQSNLKVPSASSPMTLVEPLFTATFNEIGAWSGLCQTAFAVQNCRFAESILGAQSTKVRLLELQKMKSWTENNNNASCLELWLRDTLKAIIGTFPIVFDKALAFAKPLYGFDEDMDVSAAVAEESSGLTFRSNATAEAFEGEVMETMHKYEKIGTISVAVVLDAVRTSNVRVESGFCPTDFTSRGAVVELGADPDAAVRQQFPAVYLRTLSSPVASSAPSSPRHYTASPAASPGLGSSPRLGMRRRMVRVGSRQFDDTPPPPLAAPKNMQYESDPTSWPHSEWTGLVGVLTGGSDTPVSLETVFCVENLSDSMWLVAMMKSLEQEDSGWQHWQSPRPTTETVEEDLRELVASLASMIKISDRFCAPTVQRFRDTVMERSSDEIGVGLAEELKDRGFEAGKLEDEAIFRLIKNQLKVLAAVNSENVKSGNSSLPTRSRLLRRGRRGTLNSRLTGHAESAAAFFLGKELMHTID